MSKKPIMRTNPLLILVLILALFSVGSIEIYGIDCDVTSTGLVPINDLGTGLYLGQFEGGLYPGGSNTAPPMHEAEGLARATSGIQPLDINGLPSPDGTYVLVSVGMSNTTQEFCSAGSSEPCDPWTFMGQAEGDPRVNHTTLTILNGARGGQAAALWESPTSVNYDNIASNLMLKGLSEAQVQAVWIKQAIRNPPCHCRTPTQMLSIWRCALGISFGLCECVTPTCRWCSSPAASTPVMQPQP